MVDLHAKLHQFQQNPFYGYFNAHLQSFADTAVASVCGAFMQRDLVALVEREQTIGASTAYLKFGQMAEELKEELQIEIKKQTEQNGN